MATNWPTSRDTFTNPTSGDTLDSPSHAAQHANVNDAVEAMQAHAGLVLVKPSGATNGTVGANGAVTIGSGVSSVTVNDAFSSTYDNYRITLTGFTCSVSSITFTCQLGATTTGYYSTGIFVSTGSTTVNGRASSGLAGFTVGFMGANTDDNSVAFELLSPNRVANTHFTGLVSTQSNMTALTGHIRNTTQYTAFTVFPAVGTMTGGTIRVYGYNNG